MAKVFVSTVPFAENDPTPVSLLHGAGIDFQVNPLGRKLKEEELAELIADSEVLIAGTEAITEKVMARASQLRLISRVGIGLDSVDLAAARRRGIQVAYTPDAPAKAVADLTLGLMLSLLRQVHVSNAQMHAGKWQRFFGRRLGEVTVGVIGMGRIGTGVLARLQGFGCPRVLVNDIRPNRNLETAFRFEWGDKERVFREADVITLHLPLNEQTRDLVRAEHLAQMKPDALLINTSRGGIVNEADLHAALQAGHLAGAAVDVFEQEPYDGPLREIERCLLTAHMGSMSIDCRTRMEIEATADAVRFLQGIPLKSPVPEDDFLNQAGSRS